MSEMGYNELCEWFSESMKKAISRCDELERLTDNRLWSTIALQLRGIALKGNKMATAASLNKLEIEAGLEKHSQLWATDNK